ncbi:MAG: mechanosensitive ion channel [Gammaproteobacteria bacterium]|nr:mechanosensitive ion channel [Gammaproteobacteria bacterium]
MNIKKWTLWIYFILTLLFTTTAFAISNIENAFDTVQANRTLDKLSIDLSISELEVKNLENAIDVLSKLQDQAKLCVKTTQSEIDKINQQVEETKATVTEGEKLTEAEQYLSTKKEELTKQQSACQLFVLRSEEIINSFSSKVKELSAQKLLKTTPTFLTKIATSKTLLESLHKNFNTSLFLKKSGLQILPAPFMLGIFLLLLALSFGVGFLIKKKSRFPKIKGEELIAIFRDKLKWVLIYTTKKHIIPFLFILLAFTAISIPSFINNQIYSLTLVIFGLFILETIFIVIEIFFRPIAHEKSLTDFDKTISLPLLRRLNILATLCFLGFFVYVLLLGQSIPAAVMDFLRTLFITLFSISLITVLWLVNRLPNILKQHKILRISISLVLTILLLTLLTTEWLGYQYLVNYILKGITLTVLSTFLAWIFYKMISGILKIIDAPESRIRQYLHLKKTQSIPEIMWFGLIFFVLIWGGYVLSLLKIWGLSDTEFRKIITILSEGFKAANLKFIPARIFYGFVLFTVLFTLVRGLRILIEKKWRIDKTIDTIIAYITTFIFLIISLLVAGVNFEGLAIIAGALSVGIGFGLQNIVNNFVSGIILLLEKPIKPGDRIAIEGTEGFVKKISIRSTQIQALNLSNIIVPNAELISKNVINLSLRDDNSRINIIVGVAYDSNIELVKKVLMEVANAHPDVVTEDLSKQPSIYFTAFEASSLRFELYCTIRDVNAKYRIISELNTAINKAFKENNIEIPCPQMEVKLKNKNVHPQSF